MHNGVDVTDLTRNYTNEEWSKLSPEFIQNIRDAREAAKANAKKRNVAAVVAAVEVPVQEVAVDAEEEAEASNGSSFGSGAPNVHKDLHSLPDWRLGITASAE
jgi:hypothetical protein